MTARTENEHLARYQFAMELVAGKRVADIACGSGYGTQMLSSAGARSVHGMDISEEAVEFARQQYNTANVTYSVGNAQDLMTISDGEFDVVVSFETIEHIEDVEAYLDEMKRILCPGGVFVVSSPDRRLASFWHWYSRSSQKPLPCSGIHRARVAGFVVYPFSNQSLLWSGICVSMVSVLAGALHDLGRSVAYSTLPRCATSGTNSTATREISR